MMESIGEDFSPMKLLPTEILQKILSYLPAHDRVRVERVCKRWKNVSTERIWRDVRVLTIAERLEEKSDLFFYPYEDSNKSSKINTMDYDKLYIDIDELGVIESLVSRAGQHVKEFIFDSEKLAGNNPPVLSIIATHCHNIESIQLGYAYDVDIEVISRIFQNNKKLHSIAYGYANNFIDILPPRDWKSLYIGGSGGDKKQWENKVVALIENSPFLEKVYVWEWTVNIGGAISRCARLTDLFFPICDDIVWYDLLMDTSWLNRLTCLRMEHRFEDDLLVILLHHCINLESLHLLYWNGHQAELPDKVQEAILDLPKLKCLKLDIRGLTDKMLSRLLRIKDLRLKGCVHIGDYEILKMIKNSECLEKLEILDMNVTTKLFEELVHQDVGERCKNLRIRVQPAIYEEALRICKGSRIHIMTKLDDLVSDIGNWMS